jgi:hypothetical protein
MSDQEWIDVKTASEILDMSPRGVRYLCSNGEFEGAEKFGSQWRIPRAEVQPTE